MNKKIIVSVISDIVTDQRVQKECNTFYKMGYEVVLIGRKSKNAFVLNDLPYKIIRFTNLFTRGPLMYLVFNIQLFFYLLFKKADVLWANDLDTLLPNFIIARLKGIKLVYDSHEYFTLTVIKQTSRKVWEMLELFLFPRLKNVITVNDSIKEVYEKKYKVNISVVRNVPYKFVKDINAEEIILPVNKKILVMQGIGLNENRGAEEAVFMMQFLPDEFMLYFIGWGTILDKLKQMVHDLRLQSKIIFIAPLPYKQMMEYTRQCFLGLVFIKIDLNDAHLFTLPNKFFDYIHAGIPVVASKGSEIQKIIDKYNVGAYISNLEPTVIAKEIAQIAKADEYKIWKQNTVVASTELCWENEEQVIINFMANLK
ncbi:MAG: glycosyltransferase [Ginsengibacter sp.]